MTRSDKGLVAIGEENWSNTGWRQSETERLLHEGETSIRARLQSIEADTEAALSLYVELQTTLPLVANARAGRWYVPSVVDSRATYSASFKSADGHYGTWALSPRRPNLHFLQLLVNSRGAVLFDATRAGKRFPDALTRTVPIWCAAVTLLARLIHCNCTTSCCPRCIDKALHFPPTVPPTERSRIAALLPQWISAWSTASPRVRDILASQSLPIRPLWLTPARPLWTDGLPSADTLGFVPVVCVSVSVPLLPNQRKDRPGRSRQCVVAGVRFAPRPMSYPYVQGAGDDEEFWSCGLTPTVFWNERDRILASDNNAYVERDVITIVAAAANSKSLSLAPPAHSLELAQSRIFIHVNLAPESLNAISALYEVIIVVGEQAPDDEGNQLAQKQRCPVLYFPLFNSRGRPDSKHALCRALGAILRALRSAAGRVCIVGVQKHGKDAAAAIAVAWIAWHCQLPELVKLHEPRTRFDIDKCLVQSAMLAVLSERPDLSLSRAALIQITRFFLSPNPPSSADNDE